jgi:hypothetical protein
VRKRRSFKDVIHRRRECKYAPRRSTLRRCETAKDPLFLPASSAITRTHSRVERNSPCLNLEPGTPRTKLFCSNHYTIELCLTYFLNYVWITVRTLVYRFQHFTAPKCVSRKKIGWKKIACCSFVCWKLIFIFKVNSVENCRCYSF